MDVSMWRAEKRFKELKFFLSQPGLQRPNPWTKVGLVLQLAHSLVLLRLPWSPFQLLSYLINS